MSQTALHANILVVDDTPDNLRLLSGMLSEQGHTVRPFPRGALALKAAAVDPPDMVLLDINMPQMDGFEVCRRLKEDPALADIPVLFISALTDARDKVRAFEAGGVDYITKPFRFEEVRARVETHLRLHQLKKIADQRFQETFEHASVGIAITNPDGTFDKVNPWFCSMLGYTLEEAETLTVEGITLPGDMDVGTQAVRALYEGSVGSFTTTKRYVRKDGSVMWGSLSLGPVREPDGSIRHAVAVVKDITEQRQAEEELQRHRAHLEDLVEERTAELARANEELQLSEERYRSLFDSSPDAILIVGLKSGQIRFANSAACDLLGYGLETLTSLTNADIHPPDMRDQVKKSFREKKRGKVTFTPDVPCLRADGEIVYVDIGGAVIDLGGVPHAMGIFRDITERRQAEEQVRKLSRAVEQSPTSVVVTAPDGTIEYVNPKFCEVTGYTAEEAVGQNPSILSSGRLSSEFYESMWDTLSAGKEWRGEFSNKRKDGGEFWEYASISPIRDDHDVTTHYVAVKEDITERKRMEDDLRQAREAAEEANRAKSAFLAGMSHELRTPLNAIIGFAEVLADETFGELNDKQKRYVDHVEGSGKHLLSLINDVLDLSKVEAGKMELELGPVDVGALLQRSVLMIREKTHKHGIQLTTDVTPELEGAVLQADERKLMQVLFNLLSNAAKFTPDGGSIEGRAWREDGQVFVSVRDSGIGLAPEDQERVFGEFEQADSSLARQHQGTGLGLALSRSLMELHDGRLWVESEGKGMGSTFTLSMPARQAAGPGEEV